MSLEITSDGLVVRAPLKTPQKQIEAFVASHERWAASRLGKLESARERAAAKKLTDEEIASLREAARREIPKRVALFAPAVGVHPGKITIRLQKTRWGSCSSSGNLSFNCLLMLTPPEVVDSVVVHELCHMKHRDHSKEFYSEVLAVYPEYRRWNGWLKENGRELLLRAFDR